jgi:predicted dehydrogenase
MLEDADIDAVFILTSGSHAPIAVAAANAGKHVLVEKPMCFSVAEGLEMKAAADAAGVTLMVAYPKRYDPAFERFREVAVDVTDPRLMRVTTFESPFLPYIGHYALTPVAPIPQDAIETFTAQTQASITRAIGEATPFLREEYHLVLLDTLVHELNTVRGVLGEPTSLEYVDMQPGQLTVILKFGQLSVPIHWMDLPGITRYGMEFALYGPDRRVTLSFPSPFLRSAPAIVEIVEGEVGTTKSRSISEITSYESAFKVELQAFHHCVVTGEEPVTSAEDAIHDLALCEAIIRFAQDPRPIPDPSAIAALTSAN